MTTDIKAAIAGAIEALEDARSELWEAWHSGMAQWEFDSHPTITYIDASIAALRRIEFVEVDEFKRGPTWLPPARVYWNEALDHLTTTGHAIVKMGDI